jgi:isopenicillin N synthase-like dioxygenase
MALKEIPSIDLADFTQGNARKRAQFIQQIGEAFTSVGFVSVKNHGISDALIANMYEEVKRFYALPLETKLKYEIPGLAGQRGYTSFGKEKAKQSEVGDLKEFWQFGQIVEGETMSAEHYPPNPTGEEIESFNQVFEAAYRAFEKSGSELLRAISLYLQLPENFFDDKIKNGNSILRAIHYPPITQEPASAIRAEQHEDINLITLLIGASADGLQVLTLDGEWISVRSSPDHIVINVGDMLQRLTNNVLRSTTHRVVNPPRELWHTSRFSIPFFLHPRDEMRLDVLATCVNEANPAHYPGCTAGEYLNERLIEIGLKK